MKKFKAIGFLVAVEEKDVDVTVSEIHELLFNHKNIQYVFTHEVTDVEALGEEYVEELNSVIDNVDE